MKTDPSAPERRVRRRALLGGATIAGGYVLVAGAYIVVSTLWVGEAYVGSADQTQVELLKGLGFVLVTALLLMIALVYLLGRLQRTESALAARAGALARAQQHTIVGTLAAAVGHDMKNMLAALEGNIDMMREEAGGELREMADDSKESIRRLRELSRELMTLGHGSERHIERVDLRQVVKDCVRLSRLFAKDNHCAFVVDVPRGCLVDADRRELEHVVMNLVLNAAEATGGDGQVEIRGSKQDGEIVLRVADDGPGVPAEIRGQIFQPFFTTKDTGTGMGLAITRDIMRQYRGDVLLRDSDSGAEFQVTMASPGEQPCGSR